MNVLKPFVLPHVHALVRADDHREPVVSDLVRDDVVQLILVWLRSSIASIGYSMPLTGPSTAEICGYGYGNQRVEYSSIDMLRHVGGILSTRSAALGR